MGVTVAATRVACQVAGGNQDITTADLGGLTPSAAFFKVTRATADGVAASHAILGLGACTGAANRWAAGCRSQDAQDTTVTSRRIVTDECVLVIDPATGNVDGEADFAAWLPNGIRINWGDAPSAGFLLTVTFFAGTSLSAQASNFALQNAVGATTDVNTVGFEPDALVTVSGDALTLDSDLGGSYLSYGVVLNKAGVEQYSISFHSDNTVGTSAVQAYITDDYGICQVTSAGLNYGGEFGSFDAAGFSCTTRVGVSGGDLCFFLALAFGGAVGFEGGVIDSPTVVGVQNVTDPGIRPQFVLVGLSQLAALDALAEDSTAGSVGLSAFDADEAYCSSVQDEDGQGVSDTQSLSDDQVVNFPLDSGAAGHAATFVSFNTDGWTWNFIAVTATAKKWWYLAIEEAPPAPTPAAVAVLPPALAELRYELWLTDDRGLRLAAQGGRSLLATALWFRCARVANGIGWFEMGLPCSFDVDFIAPDRMVQVWRKPRGGTLSLWRVYFLRKWRFATTADGETLVISGPDTNDLLRRRVVAAYAGLPQSTKTLWADDMMKEVVAEAMSDLATPAPAAGTRAWPDLSVAPDVSAAPVICKAFAFEPLLSSSSGGVLPAIARASREAGTDLYFDVAPDVVGAASATFRFHTYVGQPGMDLTGLGVLFDQERGNMRDPSLEYDYSDEVNYVYAGGQGEGIYRAVEQVYDAARYGVSQWARCEGFADARSQEAVGAVREAGRSALEKGRPAVRFGATPEDTEEMCFGVHWDFGYKVRSRYRGQEFDAVVKTVVLAVDRAGKETVQARLEWSSD